jgi:hypothetical protein
MVSVLRGASAREMHVFDFQRGCGLKPVANAVRELQV